MTLNMLLQSIFIKPGKKGMSYVLEKAKLASGDPVNFARSSGIRNPDGCHDVSGTRYSTQRGNVKCQLVPHCQANTSCWFEIMCQSQRTLLEHLFHPYVQFTRFSAFKFADSQPRKLGGVRKESNPSDPPPQNSKMFGKCIVQQKNKKQPNKTFLIWRGNKQIRTNKGVDVSFHIN